MCDAQTTQTNKRQLYKILWPSASALGPSKKFTRIKAPTVRNCISIIPPQKKALNDPKKKSKKPLAHS
jgi:hypothetical protein